MKVGTDSDLLGTLSAGGRHILDIGTGTGVLSLMLAQRYPEAVITAIEIDDNAVLDASRNFQASRYRDRITLHHLSFQDYLAQQQAKGEVGLFDSVVCNPPYFDKSLEPEDEGRMRARHSASLPFRVLARGAYELLSDGGVFSVCIPPEVFTTFNTECLFAGFSPLDVYEVKSVPEKPVKRYVLVYRKGGAEAPRTHACCMRNADRTRSSWYMDLMKDFLVHPASK